MFPHHVGHRKGDYIIYCINWDTFESKKDYMNNYIRTIGITWNCSGKSRTCDHWSHGQFWKDQENDGSGH